MTKSEFVEEWAAPLFVVVAVVAVVMAVLLLMMSQ
jgi:hypothetical protein